MALVLVTAIVLCLFTVIKLNRTCFASFVVCCGKTYVGLCQAKD